MTLSPSGQTTSLSIPTTKTPAFCSRFNEVRALEPMVRILCEYFAVTFLFTGLTQNCHSRVAMTHRAWADGVTALGWESFVSALIQSAAVGSKQLYEAVCQRQRFSTNWWANIWCAVLAASGFARLHGANSL